MNNKLPKEKNEKKNLKTPPNKTKKNRAKKNKNKI